MCEGEFSVNAFAELDKEFNGGKILQYACGTLSFLSECKLASNYIKSIEIDYLKLGHKFPQNTVQPCVSLSELPQRTEGVAPELILRRCPVSERVRPLQHVAPGSPLDPGPGVAVLLVDQFPVIGMDTPHRYEHRRAGAGIAVMLEQVQPQTGAGDFHVERHARLEPVVEPGLEPEGGAVELARLGLVEDAQYRHRP